MSSTSLRTNCELFSPSNKSASRPEPDPSTVFRSDNKLAATLDVVIVMLPEPSKLADPVWSPAILIVLAVFSFVAVAALPVISELIVLGSLSSEIVPALRLLASL